MSGQVSEYISNTPVKTFTTLESLTGFTFDTSKKYAIINNGACSIRFTTASSGTPTYFGTILSQKDTIWYNKSKAGTLYVMGESFNLSILEV